MHIKDGEKTMKTIAAAVAFDGNIIRNSDYFNDYPFPRLLDFRDHELVISNFYKMKTADYRDHLVTIPYEDITEVTLKVVKRVRGQRISFLSATYDFDIRISTSEYDEWNIETEAVYQILEALKKTGKLNDVAGISEHFASAEQFYDLSDREISEGKAVIGHRDSNRNDFQKYCDDNYDSWMKEFGFESGRLTYPDRKI